MDADAPFNLAWDQVARRWGLAPADLPQAVNYVYSILCAAEGLLTLVEVQLRLEGERYVFRSADPALGEQLITVDRPRGWDDETERQACEDIYLVLRHRFTGDASPPVGDES